MTTTLPPQPDDEAVVANRITVAADYGVLTDAVRRTATRHGWYVHTSPELLNLLIQVNLDAAIPPLLYQASAELLVWLYELQHDDAA